MKIKMGGSNLGVESSCSWATPTPMNTTATATVISEAIASPSAPKPAEVAPPKVEAAACVATGQECLICTGCPSCCSETCGLNGMCVAAAETTPSQPGTRRLISRRGDGRHLWGGAKKVAKKVGKGIKKVCVLGLSSW